MRREPGCGWPQSSRSRLPCARGRQAKFASVIPSLLVSGIFVLNVIEVSNMLLLAVRIIGLVLTRILELIGMSVVGEFVLENAQLMKALRWLVSSHLKMHKNLILPYPWKCLSTA